MTATAKVYRYSDYSGRNNFGRTGSFSSSAGTGARETLGARNAEQNERQDVSIGTIYDPVFEEMRNRVLQLFDFESGWDGYQAKEINRDTAIFGLGVALKLQSANMIHPFIAPLAYGGIQFEWENENATLELEVRGPYEIGIYLEDRVADSVIEERLRDNGDLEKLNQIMTIARERLRVRPEQGLNT